MKLLKRNCIIMVIAMLLLFTLSACAPEDAPGESRTDKVGIHSNLLGRVMNVEIHLPGKYSEDSEYKVLYLLHDYMSKEGSIRQAGFFRVADILTEQGIIEPMIIVAPQIDNSYLLNSSEKNIIYGDDTETGLYSGMYEDYFTDEVVKYVESTYSVAKNREGRYIGGISTGGYAALRMAFANPDMFSKAGGHMPALWTPRMELMDMNLFGWLYPTEGYRDLRDINILAANEDIDDLEIFIDCGASDMYSKPGTEELFDVLSDRQCDVEVLYGDGKHDFDYIAENVQKYLKFYGGFD